MYLDDRKHSDQHLKRNETLLLNRHMETFPQWLAIKINMNSNGVSSTLKWLSYGPKKQAMSYSGYVINGHRFHTRDAEKSTQNNGVSIDVDTHCRSSADDITQVVGRISYYGVIRYIILLDYYTFQIPIFKCDWANIRNGVKIEDGFMMVNLNQGQNQFERDPFI